MNGKILIRAVQPRDFAQWKSLWDGTTRSMAGKIKRRCRALDWIKIGSKYEGFFKWLELEADKTKKGTFGANHILPPCPACQSKLVSDIGP
jgi:hypothetical protein